ncbi:hypothetical protein L6R52_35735, partial [Myxococcota bacterium]|nr:hypothetical protein [Myxococcota bacterium]
DRTGAEAALAKLGDRLAECLGAAGATDQLRVSIVVDVDGVATAMSADGPSPAKDRFSSCARPLLVGAELGASTTLRAGAQEQITGGVVRFRIGRGVQ